MTILAVQVLLAIQKYQSLFLNSISGIRATPANVGDLRRLRQVAIGSRSPADVPARARRHETHPRRIGALDPRRQVSSYSFFIGFEQFDFLIKILQFLGFVIDLFISKLLTSGLSAHI